MCIRISSNPMRSRDSSNTIKVIRGGTLMDPSLGFYGPANLFIQNGFIKEITDRSPPETCEIIDASGLLVTPGFIDMHAHFREPGFEEKEDIESGGKSAAAGGFTTVFCMPNTNPVNDNPKVSRFIIEKALKFSDVRVIPIGALSKSSKGSELSDIEGMANLGLTAFSDDGSCIQDSSLMKIAAETVRSFGGIVIDHAEDFSFTQDGVIHEGRISAKLGLKGISRESENRIISRDIKIADETGAHIHIAHLSTKEGVLLIRKAKADGIKITAEVTPHHLTLTEEALLGLNTMMKVKPPLRTEEDRLALIEGLKDGTIDVIATDHAPHEAESKALPMDKASFGMIGLETALPVCLKLVHEEKISLLRMVEALTLSPAQILGFADRGSLAKGKLADITIFDLNETVIIDSSRFFSKSRNTPFEGMKLKGRVKKSIVGGKIVYNQ